MAAATSGRAVLVSGFTVMVAMAGMYITGNATFQSFATGTIMVVAAAVVGSLTVLPALLSLLGDNINKGRVPFVNRLHKSGAESGFWSAIVGAVLRHPIVSVALAGGLLVLSPCPPAPAHGNSGVQGLPRDLPVMQTYDRIQEAFPGEPLAATGGAEDRRRPLAADHRRHPRAAQPGGRTGADARPGHHGQQPGRQGGRDQRPRWPATAPTRRPTARWSSCGQGGSGHRGQAAQRRRPRDGADRRARSTSTS
jgi:hypothetical protein